MSGEIDHLWALRDLDERAFALRGELKRFPEQRAQLERAMIEQKSRIERHRNETAALQLKRRETEREIESLTTQERKFQSQLPAVKKNEEYQALLHEIAGVRRKRSDLETEVLMAFESEERVSGERAETERALQSAQREATERTQRIDAEESAHRERLAAIDAERAAHVAGLPPLTRSRYERIHQSREGRAVVAIQKGACGGCYRGQPPQILQDARKRDRLQICEGCGRILVWPPDAA
jgi:predicted  nucleic acid-binding Zn-ribbon protein